MEDNSKTIIIKSNDTGNDKFDPNLITEFFYLCISNWKWFLLSLALSLSLAFLYIQTTPPQYTRSASVHIKEDSRSSSIGNIADEFSKLGLGNTSSSVNNEEVAFNSVELAEQVVRKLHLDIMYRTQHGLYKQLLYGKNLPISAEFTDLTDNDEAQLKVTVWPSGKVDIDDQEKETPIHFTRTSNSTSHTEPITIYIKKVPLKEATYRLHEQLHAYQNNTKNSVIDITYSDENMERAEDVINTLISEYNKNWVKDKNAMAVLTTQFIDERINAIQKELGGVDSDIASYKSSNLITDPSQAASLLLSQANASDQQAMALSNQIQMCQYLYDYISQSPLGGHGRALIPANVGIQSENVNTQISAFNQKLLQRNTYANNSSDNNPLVQNLDSELTSERSAILQSLTNEKKSLEAQLLSSRHTITQSTSKLSSAPAKEKNLLSMDRQQKVKEALYLFLLQKREENELSQAFTAYNTRVVCRPMGLDRPTSPVSSSIYFVAIIIALLLPIAILYIRELINTRVRGRKDLDKLSVPFLGEIPEMKTKTITKTKTKIPLLVEQGKRDIVNEAFRVVRTNLGFMLNPNCCEKRKVVQVTSANPGSGKTFLSINLAASFGLQNKTKIIILDLDIRKASLSKVIGSPAYGVSDYLGGFKNDWKELIRQIDNNTMTAEQAGCFESRVDVLPVGHIPPNPAELLQSPRLKTLIEELKAEYDIIFLDMPPAETVADVSIVKHLADLTLYVVRAGHVDRAMLPVIERYYKDKTFNNLAIILNGSEVQTHRYGYGYSYGYGYGYGYDY